jgi:ribA/ribD-fused uncharacterized protein
MDNPIVHQGIAYWTVENFYQAMKTEKQDIQTRSLLANMNPYEAKKFGRRIKLRPDWNSIKLQVMECALKHKFKKGTSWYSRLLQDAGPVIEHNTWHDNYWGDCHCSRCRNTKGLNHLGRLIEQMR